MGLNIILKIVLFGLLIAMLIYIIKLSRAMKLINRIDKYVVNNNSGNLSIGDYLTNVYLSFNNAIYCFLGKYNYIRNSSKKYNIYSLNNDGLEIVSTKVCLTLLFGFIYFVYSVMLKNFNFFILILICFLGYYVYNIYISIVNRKRKKLIEEDLLRAIVIMNNAFKSGYNIIQAVDMVVKDLTGPISEEFKKISNDLKYGLDVKDVFERFYNRVRIEDIKYITSSLSLLNVTGGNLVGVFTNIENSFTNNKRLKDELNSMTASSKLVYYVLLVMPIFLILILLMISPDYFMPLISTTIGYFIILLILILYISYIVIIKRILKVDYE